MSYFVKKNCWPKKARRVVIGHCHKNIYLPKKLLKIPVPLASSIFKDNLPIGQKHLDFLSASACAKPFHLFSMKNQKSYKSYSIMTFTNNAQMCIRKSALH